MDFVSSEKKENSDVIERDAIWNGMRVCLELSFSASWQRDVTALGLYVCGPKMRAISFSEGFRVSKHSSDRSSSLKK